MFMFFIRREGDKFRRRWFEIVSGVFIRMCGTCFFRFFLGERGEVESGY